MYKKELSCLLAVVLCFSYQSLTAQSKFLTIKQALDSVMQNYKMIQSKQNIIKAAESQLNYNQLLAIPDLNVAAQNSYGTINNTYGPAAGLMGNPSISSSGPMMPSQNWNAAFGGLYLANVNWNFFSFGKIKQGVKVANADLNVNKKDLDQEVFQDKVKACAAYLNLLGAQQLTKVASDNLNRAVIVKNAVIPRVLSGLNPGVDSSFAVAQVASAQMAVTRSKDREQELSNALIKLLGTRDTTEPILDSMFITQIPTDFLDSLDSYTDQHPVLQYYDSQIKASKEQEKYIHTQYFPTFTFFSTYQARGSGFKNDYGSSNPDAYTSNYFQGVGTLRSNYLTGISATWNLSNPIRLKKMVERQKNITSSLEDQYYLNDQQLLAQVGLANNKIKNALANYYQIPLQLKAANDAFIQKTVQYKNGLNTIIDVQQALYLLNSAEIDKYIAYNNVWQALLIKAAATGNLELFLSKL